ncbi:hypothetical protein SISNIDRAFT_459758 [Sistotremastrum niveocremeum HHB9708]|uniref:Uncharacterized protein n=2 Tax=Sistotremastraceae TaxID=3402574 RepID=A0A164PAA6_9AGAM|nr:hypothetical protein SISNIDRAFT_459758 [Sistotremastrum niveocremeum HHB9708]KZT34122.1 hypothetical protein SISSUDRAFT_1053322 [Sistotremastrum suecicum HHB10207 ss-3]
MSSSSVATRPNENDTPQPDTPNPDPFAHLPLHLQPPNSRTQNTPPQSPQSPLDYHARQPLHSYPLKWPAETGRVSKAPPHVTGQSYRANEHSCDFYPYYAAASEFTRNSSDVQTCGGFQDIPRNTGTSLCQSSDDEDRKILGKGRKRRRETSREKPSISLSKSQCAFDLTTALRSRSAAQKDCDFYAAHKVSCGVKKYESRRSERGDTFLALTAPHYPEIPANPALLSCETSPALEGRSSSPRSKHPTCDVGAQQGS